MKTNFCSYILFGSLLIQLTSQYIHHTVEDDDLCSPIKRRKIELGRGPLSGLVVKQTQLNSHSIPWTSNFKCKFRVEPLHSSEGIIAVIQELSFRKDTTTGECIDYIQFVRRSDGSKSQKFCGRFNAAVHMDHNFVDPSESVSVGNSFVTESGDLDVEIFVLKEPLSVEEENDLSLVFTSYSHCSKVLRRDTSYRPCSFVRKEFCIYTGFFGDVYINCPLPDCKDESGCSKPADVTSSPDLSETALIASLSTVTLLFALFTLLLWIFKTYKIFCWSESCSSPAPPRQDQSATTRVIEMNDQVGVPSESQPNAPPLEEEDKDLPPSYESLFPER